MVQIFATDPILGSFCFKVRTGSKRSPFLLIRLRTSLLSNVNNAASPLFFASATSFHVTGVETVGWSFARREYAQTVVLCSSFWLVDEAGFPPTQDSGGVNPVRAMGWTLLFRKRKSRQLRPDIF
jgi:hypothetical protein